jgi:mRNA interferase RelE/StbE
MAALYGFAYAASALLALETVQPPKVRAQMKRRVQALTSNPKPPGSKKLHNIMDGDFPVYRIRQGDYRVLYSVRNNPDQIVVLDIGHRKDIYR